MLYLRIPKQIIQRIARLSGYEIRRAPSGDAFTAQAELLGSTRVTTIVDVGAYIGDVTLRYRKLFPGARIFALEPYPPSFAALRHRVADFAAVHNVAVGETNGVVALNVNNASYTNSLLPIAESSKQFVSPTLTRRVASVEVCLTTLDRFFGEQGIRYVNVLKLDIQGSELAALRGARGMLSQGRIGLIYTEVNFAPIYVGQPSLRELQDYLEQFGFALAGLYSPVVAVNDTLTWADAIFLNARRDSQADPA